MHQRVLGADLGRAHGPADPPVFRLRGEVPPRDEPRQEAGIVERARVVAHGDQPVRPLALCDVVEKGFVVGARRAVHDGRDELGEGADDPEHRHAPDVAPRLRGRDLVHVALAEAGHLEPATLDGVRHVLHPERDLRAARRDPRDSAYLRVRALSSERTSPLIRILQTQKATLAEDNA